MRQNQQFPSMARECGKLASVMSANKAYEVPPVVGRDYIQPGDLVLLDAKDIKQLRLEAMKVRNKKVSTLMDQYSPFWARLMGLTSIESQEAMQYVLCTMYCSSSPFPLMSLQDTHGSSADKAKTKATNTSSERGQGCPTDIIQAQLHRDP